MKKSLLVVIVACTMTILCVSQAFASDNLLQLESSFIEIYDNLKILAWGGGIVGLACCAISYFVGDESKAKKALTGAGYVLLALFALILLAKVVDFGKTIGGDILMPWDPADSLL